MRGDRESLDVAIIGKRGFRLKKKIPNRTIFLARSFERICGQTEIVSLFFIFSNRGDAGCRKSVKPGFVSMFSLVMVSPIFVPSCARLQSQEQGASCKIMGQTSTKSDRSSRMNFFGIRVSTQTHFSSFPRKRESRSGTIRLIAFPQGFPAVFPFVLLCSPVFAGMTKGGGTEGLSRKSGKRQTSSMLA
jgi:hypothetical protein